MSIYLIDYTYAVLPHGENITTISKGSRQQY